MTRRRFLELQHFGATAPLLGDPPATVWPGVFVLVVVLVAVLAG